MLLVIFSCEKQDERIYAFPEPSSPYEDPIWHPSGEIIGFYHRPIKEIHYDYSYNRPIATKYVYEKDSAGFWLIDSDGTNQRRVLPELYNPIWSPDGNWISFVQSGRTFKMPFDGERFDTSAVVPVTTELCTYQTSWSPDGKQITYGKASCDDNDNKVGAWIKNMETGTEKFIGRYVYYMSWHPTDDSIVYLKSDSLMLYDNTADTKKLLLAIPVSTTESRDLEYSPTGDKIAFISDRLYLYTLNPDGTGLKRLSDSIITSYSWSPAGEIVYLNFDYNSIDEAQGTLWIMNADGTNKRQLTHNHFQVYP